MPSAEPLSVGPYQLLQRVGVGGFADVFRGRHRQWRGGRC